MRTFLLCRRIDQLEECLSNSQEGIPLKSRASSNSSLDRLSNDSGTPLSNSAPVNGNSAMLNPALQNPVSWHRLPMMI